MKSLKIALDWTPNVNHIGFLVAQEIGLYSQVNLDIEILHPGTDNYLTTPAKKVELAAADFALCPMESIISYRTKTYPFGLKAVAAIFQEDLSAIACLANNTIDSPKALDGKIYASYKARYEDEIVKQMIRNDGGNGDIEITYPEKLGIWETIINGKSDATWIFLNWEGIQAESLDMDLQLFKMRDFHIPYAYSPVIAADEYKIQSEHETYKAFLLATKKGFLYAKENLADSAHILAKYIPDRDQNIDLVKSLTYSTQYLGNNTNWGLMEEKSVAEFLTWIYKHNLETKQLIVSDLITNELLT
ncbi:MAG: ABC transporter substrate-binding protein [Bacteroidota bacterium]